jgi:hypothetical protein
VAALALTTLLLASHPALVKRSHRLDSVSANTTTQNGVQLKLDARNVRSSSDTTATGTIAVHSLLSASASIWADVQCLRVNGHGESIVVARITSTTLYPGSPIRELRAWTFYDLSSPGGSAQNGKDLVDPNLWGTKVDSATCETPPSEPPASATGFESGDVIVKDRHKRRQASVSTNCREGAFSAVQCACRSAAIRQTLPLPQ